jgi:hypothetical protein
LSAFKNQTVYASDPVGAEYNVSAAGTLCLRPGLCVRAYDCDDGCIAVGAALLSVGIPVQVVKQTFGKDDQEHVLLEVQDENGNWLAVDPSTDKPVGQKVWATSEFRMDPMNPSMIGLKGVPDADYVGVGSPHAARRVLGLGDASDDSLSNPVPLFALIVIVLAAGATAAVVTEWVREVA